MRERKKKEKNEQNIVRYESKEETRRSDVDRIEDGRMIDRTIRILFERDDRSCSFLGRRRKNPCFCKHGSNYSTGRSM